MMTVDQRDIVEGHMTADKPARESLLGTEATRRLGGESNSAVAVAQMDVSDVRVEKSVSRLSRYIAPSELNINN